MSKHRIFTIGCNLPGADFEYIQFSSDQTLLDADIVLFEPGFHGATVDRSYQGLSCLNEHSSFRLPKYMAHWHSEIISAVKAGKIVVIYLAKPIEGFRYTGEKAYSGTGRNARKTNYVAEVTSYEAVPDLRRVTAKSGSTTRLTKDAQYLGPYWKEFSEYCPYEAEIDGNFTRKLLTTSAGDRVVGAALHVGNGALIFLPPIRYNVSKFIRRDNEKSFWTKEAQQFGKRLASALGALADAVRADAVVTPTPTWAEQAQYRLDAENDIESRITAVSAEITAREQQRADLEAELRKTGALRGLLFEQGKPLESAVLEALRLMGFASERFEDGESEFDAVFVSPEGRCLGEAEGKDRHAINIDKMSQLERNIGEDFAREGVESHKKGVLFGNAHRLSPVEQRGEFFTRKCISAAARIGVALVRTPDMFGPAKHLKKHPEDVAYAAACREAIFGAGGSVVQFPPVPASDVEVVMTHVSSTEPATK